MQILKLLNKKFLIIFFLSFTAVSSNEPVDIWNIDKKEIEENSKNLEETSNTGISSTSNNIDVFKMQLKNNNNLIEVDNSLDSKVIKLIGLYDPEDYGLKIDMWLNSNGDQLKYLFSNLSKIDLSNDASDLMKVALLTNAYYPNTNITKKEFLKIKSDWLIKNKDLDLIEEYLIKNQILNLHPELSRYLIDNYLSESNVIKACEYFLEIQK